MGSVSNGFGCRFGSIARLLPYSYWTLPREKPPEIKNPGAISLTQRDGCTGCLEYTLLLEEDGHPARHQKAFFSPPDRTCWLRNSTGLADRSRTVTASREISRFRRKLTYLNVSLNKRTVKENVLPAVSTSALSDRYPVSRTRHSILAFPVVKYQNRQNHRRQDRDENGLGLGGRRHARNVYRRRSGLLDG